MPGKPPRPPESGEADLLVRFMEAEQAEQAHIRALSRGAPAWARRTLGSTAAACGERARRLSAAYYLLTGEAYRPDGRQARIYTGRWPKSLRERCQSLYRLGQRYARAAGETGDPFLKKLLDELSALAYRNAGDLFRLLEQGVETLTW